MDCRKQTLGIFRNTSCKQHVSYAWGVFIYIFAWSNVATYVKTLKIHVELNQLKSTGTQFWLEFTIILWTFALY